MQIFCEHCQQHFPAMLAPTLFLGRLVRCAHCGEAVLLNADNWRPDAALTLEALLASEEQLAKEPAAAAVVHSLPLPVPVNLPEPKIPSSGGQPWTWVLRGLLLLVMLLCVYYLLRLF